MRWKSKAYIKVIEGKLYQFSWICICKFSGTVVIPVVFESIEEGLYNTLPIQQQCVIRLDIYSTPWEVCWPCHRAMCISSIYNYHLIVLKMAHMLPLYLPSCWLHKHPFSLTLSWSGSTMVAAVVNYYKKPLPKLNQPVNYLRHVQIVCYNLHLRMRVSNCCVKKIQYLASCLESHPCQRILLPRESRFEIKSPVSFRRDKLWYCVCPIPVYKCLGGDKAPCKGNIKLTGPGLPHQLNRTLLRLSIA